MQKVVKVSMSTTARKEMRNHNGFAALVINEDRHLAIQRQLGPTNQAQSLQPGCLLGKGMRHMLASDASFTCVGGTPLDWSMRLSRIINFILEALLLGTQSGQLRLERGARPQSKNHETSIVRLWVFHV